MLEKFAPKLVPLPNVDLNVAVRTGGRLQQRGNVVCKHRCTSDGFPGSRQGLG